MRRTAMAFLDKWLTSDNRKPLIIRGARQVGKTWLVRHFAQSTRKKLIEVNLEKYPKLATAFSSNEPTVILKRLEGAFDTAIDARDTLLFIDEIQEAPELLAKLRWFSEDMPHLPVIAAGSLLEFVLGKQELSMPVGRVSFLYLEPFSFEEFLLAQKKDVLATHLKEFTWDSAIAEVSHEKLINLFKEYVIVGGMPAAVLSWINNHSPSDVSQIHHDIIQTYRNDFGKYSPRIPSALLNEVLTAIPQHLGKKIVFSKVNANVRSTQIKEALDLLSQAKLCHLVRASASNGVPLASQLLKQYTKAILIDVGLCSADLGLSLNELESVNELDLINKGGIAEQVAGQLLRTIYPFYQEPALYYWLSTERGRDAEIDYVIQSGTHVIPIEVKAGKSGTLKSLHRFMYLKGLSKAIRINSNLPELSEINIKDTQGNNVHYQLRSIPFYLIGELNRLIA